MTKINLLEITDRRYTNNGQEAERRFRFTLTGEDCKADNLPANEGCDVADISIKSARASLCKGCDIIAHLATDKAERFAYVTADFISAYIMNKTEYIEFANEFAKPAKESSKNGGAMKLRLGHETRKMIEWLAERV